MPLLRNLKALEVRDEFLNTRVVSEYLGSGDLAFLAFHYDRQAREEVESVRRRAETERADQRPLTRNFKPSVTKQMRLRRRCFSFTATTFIHGNGEDGEQNETYDKRGHRADSVSELVERTDKENPKSEDLRKIRELLDKDDTLVRLNESSEQAFNRVINSYTTSALVKELFHRQIAEKRNAFDYESENVMVQMLINQVILCHIRLTTFDQFHAERTKESSSIASGLYWDRLLSSYQRRFQKGCESLAKVKRLLSEADYREQQARHKRGQSTLTSQRTLKNLTSD